jgi:hypothetical protein
MPLAHPLEKRPWPWRRFSYLGLLLVLASTIFGAASSPPQQQPPPAAQIRPMEPSGPAQAVAAPMDEALRLIGEAQQAYRGVRDYTCHFIKRERVNGRLQQEHTILLKVRTQPFSVDMVWLAPRALEGQEACYVAGRNGGNMRVRPSGLVGALGFRTIDVNDERAQRTSRHPITEAGIGFLIDEFAAGWQRERQWGQTEVQLAEYEFDHHRCVRVVMTHPLGGPPAGRYQHYRDVVFFDMQTHLPLRMEAYDWPHRPGDNGDLLEMYSYTGLRLNVGLGDEVFNH